MSVVARLTDDILVVCPIAGVSGGTADTATIRYTGMESADQRAAAQSVIDRFDWSDAAQAAWEADRVPERKTLRAASAAALAANADYLAIAAPTAVHVRAQTDALTRQVNHLIRRLVQLD